MNAFLPSAFMALLLIAVTPSAAQSPLRGSFDPRQLIGHWEGFVSTGDGSRPNQRAANVSLTIAPDKMTCDTAGSIGEGNYRISPGNGRLHHIDGIGNGGIYQGKTYQRILTPDGDTLKRCSSDSGRPLPTSLRTNYAVRQNLMVLTRKR